MRAAVLLVLCLVALSLASTLTPHNEKHSATGLLKMEGGLCHCHCPAFTCALIFDPDDDENDAYYFDDDDENRIIGPSGSVQYLYSSSDASIVKVTMGLAVIVALLL